LIVFNGTLPINNQRYSAPNKHKRKPINRRSTLSTISKFQKRWRITSDL
jgi:hypothetical protein